MPSPATRPSMIQFNPHGARTAQGVPCGIALLSRLRTVVGGLFALSLLLSLGSEAAVGQALVYEVGISSSWGESRGMLCEIDRCYEATFHSHANRHALGAGVLIVFKVAGPLRIESGVVIANKGWEVTQPKEHHAYLEFPLLARLGVGPGARTPVGGAILFGVAPALGIPTLSPTDFGLVGGVELDARIGGAQWSVTYRFARGTKVLRPSLLQNRSGTLLLGYSRSYR